MRGRSSSNDGIGTVGVAAHATGDTIGVYGTAVSQFGAGVKGEAQRSGIEGYATATSGAGTGVYGQCHSPSAVAILGLSQAGGPGATAILGRSVGTAIRGLGGGGGSVGVHGTSEAGPGVGVFAESPDPGGIALKVGGKAVFSRSGKATVPTGQSQVTVMGIPLDRLEPRPRDDPGRGRPEPLRPGGLGQRVEQPVHDPPLAERDREHARRLAHRELAAIGVDRRSTVCR